jgi:hypothetical protein
MPALLTSKVCGQLCGLIGGANFVRWQISFYVIQKLFIVENVIGVIGIVVDVVLGDGVDMDIIARHL